MKIVRTKNKNIFTELWYYTKGKVKQILIWVGLIGIAMAGTIALLPDQIPSVEVKGQVIEFSYTDDNSNEDLIIRTDLKDYLVPLTGGSFDMLVSVENKSGKSQIIDTQFYFPKSEITINSIERLEARIEYDVITYSSTTKTETITKKIGNGWVNTEVLDYNKTERDALLAISDFQEKSKNNQRAQINFLKLWLYQQIIKQVFIKDF